MSIDKGHVPIRTDMAENAERTHEDVVLLRNGEAAASRNIAKITSEHKQGDNIGEHSYR